MSYLFHGGQLLGPENLRDLQRLLDIVINFLLFITCSGSEIVKSFFIYWAQLPHVL